MFYTSLGYPYDFRDASMRRLSLNGMFWALEMEDEENLKLSSAVLYVF